MQCPQWLKLNKKVLLYVLGLVVFLSIAAFAGRMVDMKSVPDMPPEELWAAALENTQASNSYHYQVEILFDDKTNLRGEGERVSPDRVHLKGTMNGTKLEFISIGEDGYMKDPFSGQWLKLAGNQLADTDLFVTELNPLGMFNFKDIPELKSLGEEKIDGQKCIILSLQPNVANPFMENFVNFDYKVWIDPEDNFIRQADIKADAKGENQVKFNIKFKFNDFNENITINPPKAG